MVRKTTISFASTVDASSNKTLVSQRIGTPFSVLRVRASFAPGCERLMKLYFFVSPDNSAPTDAAPTGTNVLTQIGQVAYIVGDDEWKEFPLEILFPERGYYIKVYAENDDTFEHTIDAQVSIALVEQEGEEGKSEE